MFNVKLSYLDPKPIGDNWPEIMELPFLPRTGESLLLDNGKIERYFETIVVIHCPINKCYLAELIIKSLSA